MELKSNVETGDCSYCDQKETSVRPTPFLADVAMGAKMCWRCWSIAEQASHGEIGRFWQTEFVYSIAHRLEKAEGQDIIQGVVENALKAMPENMVYAMLAGVAIETDYDAEKGVMTLKTKNPVAVVKREGKVTVYEKKPKKI